MSDFKLNCLFKKEQFIRHVNTSQKYVVRKIPSECMVNGVPSYQLEQVDLSPQRRRSLGKPLVFHRSQVDVELFWQSIDK